MTRTISAALLALVIAVIAISCDRRGSLETRQRELPTFSVDMTLIRNLDNGKNLIEANLERDGISFSGASITVGNIEVPSMGGGLYYVNSAGFPLPAGNNTIDFQSPDDDYSASVDLLMPGDFSTTEVSPRYNIDAGDVFIDWSPSAGADYYVLAVSTRTSNDDGTTPLRLILPTNPSDYMVPDTTFENFAGDVVPGIYYIYLISFNEGFGPYEGIRFSVPEGLPERVIGNPSGLLHYGTVARLDSIIVPII